MALAKLKETNNFGIWLERINMIIDSLGASETFAQHLMDALAEAIERNQISEYLGNPNSNTVTLPDGTTETVPSTMWSWDWNKYTKNGVYWIPWVNGTTQHPPLGQHKSGMCWVASGGANGPTLQLAAIFKDSPVTTDLPDTPTMCIRYGAKGTSAISWKNWIEIPNKGYLDDNFLRINLPDLQTITGPIKISNDLTVTRNFEVNGKSTLKTVVLKGNTKSVCILPDDSSNEDNNDSTRFATFEIVNGTSITPIETPNLPLWSMSTGNAIQDSDKHYYKEPIWIDKQKRLANINGTAEYANFVVPTNMVSTFESYNIPSNKQYMPVTASAISNFYDWTKRTFLPLSGGVLTGVVKHEQDIFLDHLLGVQENRTAAIRSIVRPLQLQCQQSTHLISNTKQACLYLEKEDADSAEFTTEHHDASFIFREVRPKLDVLVDHYSTFEVINSSDQEGYWNFRTNIGTIKMFSNGKYEFFADSNLVHQLKSGEKLEGYIFYYIVNVVKHSDDENPTASDSTEEIIVDNCQMKFEWVSGDYDKNLTRSGNLTINSVYYQVAITDTNWQSLPITYKSKLAVDSTIALGSTIAKGSIINGYNINKNWVASGEMVSYGTKYETITGEIETSPATLTIDSVIKVGSTIASNSIINGTRWPKTSEVVNSDILIQEPSTLAKGTFLKMGSKLAPNSILNGYQYINEETISKIRISEESELAVGTQLLLGSLISSASTINGIPGKIGFLEVFCGANATERNGLLASGSTILKGSFLAPGTEIRAIVFEDSVTLTSDQILTEETIFGNSQLAIGSQISNDSIIAQGSSINNVDYESSKLISFDLPVESGQILGQGSKLAAGSIIKAGSTIIKGRVVSGTTYDAPATVTETIYVDGEATIGNGSRLAAGSWIDVGSIMNGFKWATGMRASGLDEILPLSTEDIAPILYIRSYDNIQEKWENSWNKYTYRTCCPTAENFDSIIWKNWINSQLNLLSMDPAFKAEIIDDLELSLNNETRDWTIYSEKNNVDSLLLHGKWRLNPSIANSPDHVFPTRCYVFSNSKVLAVQKITAQPFIPTYDSSGKRIGQEPAHTPITIYENSETYNRSFLGRAFEYFNFLVVPGMGSEYIVSYDTRLIPEQYNLSQDKVAEVLQFTVYADTLDSSGIDVATFSKTITLNIQNMMNSPFIIGARTRTGITSTGQLGDPLYDLGCIEITEDRMAFKLRKRSVSMQSDITKTAAIIFEKRVDQSGRIVPYINYETNRWFINGEDTGYSAVGEDGVVPRIKNGHWWIEDVDTGYEATAENYSTGIALRPSVNGVDLGTPELRFRNVYLEGDPIVSSDKSLKTDISDFPESLLKKWSKIKWTSFKFKDAVAAKGEDARIHSGVIAQDVKKALQGTDIAKWSFFCKDSWDDQKDIEWVDIPAGMDEFGVWREARTERREIISKEAGEQYSIRYQEMQCIENAYLRREIEILKKEIEELKKTIKK